MCKKIVLAVLIILILSCTLISLPALAESDNYNTDAFEGGKSGAAGNSIQNAAGSLLYIIKVVSVGIGLIMLTVLAMKYMLASAQERASIKQSAVVYIIGACVLFGAAGILNIIQTFTSTNLK